MPSRISSFDYGQAILEHLRTGAYPESEDIISAELPASALPDISKLIGKARDDVKVCIAKPIAHSDSTIVADMELRG